MMCMVRSSSNRESTLDAVTGPVVLVRTPLCCSLTAEQVLGALAAEPLPFALNGSWAGGGAIVGCRPLVVAGADADPFAVIDALPHLAGGWIRPEGPAGGRNRREGLAGGRTRPEHAVGGGWFGWLGYRLGARVETLPAGPPRPIPVPEFHLAYYDHVLRRAPDGQWWFEALVSPRREDELAARLREVRALLRARRRAAIPGFTAPSPLTLPRGAAADHLCAVHACRERIAAGEIFQANICLRLETEWTGSATDLFVQALGRLSPPYGSVFCTPGADIVSFSPELFLRRRGDTVITAPIKGTIGRDRDPVSADAALADLMASPKDAAEHVMIVDLMRNDLGRVCAYGSIRAPRTPTPESHPGLWHLVTRVRGCLRPGTGNGELLRATFPPGSVTGAPKVQAMHVIADLERSAREVYTGAIGFSSPVAGLELSVAIRTLELSHGRLWIGAGGGIVADSDPHPELDEALTKARPIAAAIGSSLAVPSAAPRSLGRRAVHAA
jgi:para-aminobenzoate synthetase/4-amino-4-deoxychorismate lyase